MRPGRLAVPVLLGLLVGACGGGPGPKGTPSPPEPTASPGAGQTSRPPSPSTSSPAASRTSAEAPFERRRPGVRIRVAASPFGPVLHDASGQAIYVFDRETGSRPACYGACAAAWPPVLTRGRPRAIAGTKPDLLGTTTRRDGTLQVTYRGRPLYFYAHEGKYEVLCHDISEYGGLWLAVQADGQPAPT